MPEKAIFLDRDDTLIEDPGYISSPEQVRLLDGVAGALIELKALGYKLIVVTNQSAVARGIVTEKGLGEIHDRLRQLLVEKGAFLDRIYFCPYHPDGVVPKYRKESNDRKPNPGMLLKAAKELDIELGLSWCIGNSSRDIEAGRRAGCKTILIDVPSRQKRSVANGVTPDYRGINIKEAVNIIKKYHRSLSDANSPIQREAIIQSKSDVQDSEPLTETTEPAEASFEPATEALEEEGQDAVPGTPYGEQSLSKSEQTNLSPPEPSTTTDRTEKLLTEILGHLKSVQRADMFSEFSVMRLLAGIVQILVFFCLLVSIWLMMSPQGRNNSTYIALGFAIVLQLMSLTFYIMHGRK